MELRTSAGAIRIELAPDRAPQTVANFLRLVDSGFYQGLQFHRVVPGFVAQGGGFDAQRNPREPGTTVVNESVGGLANQRGTIAMARRQDPDSAGAQFYFNLADNASSTPRASSRATPYSAGWWRAWRWSTASAPPRPPTPAAPSPMCRASPS